MKRKLLAWLLVLCMVASLMPTVALAADTSGVPTTSWGDVVTEQPDGYVVKDASNVEISSAEGLAWLAHVVNEGTDLKGFTVTLTQSVDLSAHTWVPIGGSNGNKTKTGEDNDKNPVYATVAFMGTFNGNNNTVTGLTINNADLYYAGLFGCAGVAEPVLGSRDLAHREYGKIENVKLVDVKIVASKYIGALVGATVGDINNCTVSGTISITGNYYVGGLVGCARYDSISDSSVNGGTDGGAVTGLYREDGMEGDSIGGLIGNYGSGHSGEDSTVTGPMPRTLDTCSVKNMTISGTRKVGGMIGQCYSGKIMKNFSVENVTVICTASEGYADKKKTSVGIGGVVGLFANYTYPLEMSGSVSGLTIELNPKATAEGQVIGDASTVAKYVHVGCVSGGVSNSAMPTSATVNITVSNVKSMPTGTAAYTGTGVLETVWPAVASVGDAVYPSLSDAITAANGDKTVKLLNDTTVSSTIEINKSLTLDLNGHTITNNVAGKKLFLFSASDVSFTVNANGGSMVIPDTNTTSTGFFRLDDGKSTPTVSNLTLTLNGGTYTGDVKASSDDTDYVGLISTRKAQGDVTVNLNNVTAKTNITVFDSYAAGSLHVNVTGGEYTITGSVANKRAFDLASVSNTSIYGVFTGVKITSATGGVEVEGGEGSFTNCTFVTGKDTTLSSGDLWTTAAVAASMGGVVTIESGTYTSACYGAYVFTSGGTININGGTISGDTAAVCVGVTLSSYPSAVSTININGGSIKGAFKTDGNEKSKIVVTGGIFSTDPSAYCESDKTGVKNTDSATASKYPFMIGVKNENAAEVATGAPKVESAVQGIESAGDKKTLADAAASALDGETKVSVSGSGLSAAAKDIANNIDTSALDTSGTDTAGLEGSNSVKIAVQTYMDVTLTDVDATEESKSITVDITPKYQVVATKVENLTTTELVTSGQGKNAVTVGEPQTLEVTGPVEVTIPLSTSFATSTTAYIKHIHNGKTYIYTGKIDDSGVLTFTNPNGFSEFTIELKNPSAATDGDGVGYLTLKEAVENVEDGGVITISEDNAEVITVSKTISFTVKGLTSSSINPGTYTTLTTSTDGDETLYTFVYTAPTYGGNGDKDDDDEKTETPTFTDVPEGQWYSDAVAYCAANGLMDGVGDGKFEPFTTVTRGMAITTLYRMAGSPEVSGSNGFTDLTQNWYKDAVQWGVTVGITDGISATAFDPNSAITREQLATMLYRYAKVTGIDVSEKNDLGGYTDSAKVSSFATDAMQWANAAGLVTGVTNTTLVPTADSNRATLATILMRFCESNKAE